MGRTHERGFGLLQLHLDVLDLLVKGDQPFREQRVGLKVHVWSDLAEFKLVIQVSHRFTNYILFLLAIPHYGNEILGLIRSLNSLI